MRARRQIWWPQDGRRETSGGASIASPKSFRPQLKSALQPERARSRRVPASRGRPAFRLAGSSYGGRFLERRKRIPRIARTQPGVIFAEGHGISLRVEQVMAASGDAVLIVIE